MPSVWHRYVNRYNTRNTSSRFFDTNESYSSPTILFLLIAFRARISWNFAVNLSVITLHNSTMQESNMYPVSTSIELFLWSALLLSRLHLGVAAYLKTLSHYMPPSAICVDLLHLVRSYSLSCAYFFLVCFIWRVESERFSMVSMFLQALIYRHWSVCHGKQMVYEILGWLDAFRHSRTDTNAHACTRDM